MSGHQTGVGALLATFSIGERRYFETSLDRYPTDQRKYNMAHSRRRGDIAEMVFTTSLFTAVSSSKAGDVRYLICVERVS